MDTLATVTPLPPGGSLRIVGKAHGAINAIVTPANDAGGWFFHQFVSQQELEEYISRYNLTMERSDDPDA